MAQRESLNFRIPQVTLRIPGVWTGPKELVERLPEGVRCTGEELVLADGERFEFNPLPADQEFPAIFAQSCPKLPTAQERADIEDFTVNICLTGPGGSLTAAKQIMAAGAAVLEAGGAGVFIDNCGLAHGASDWLTLLESADDGGAYWAFVATVRGDAEIYSMGMHILGCRDAIIPSTGDEEFDRRTLHSFLGYTAFSGALLHDGDIVNDPTLPTFRVATQADDRVPSDAPMFNPYGRWKLATIDATLN
jgi:hypothetical protein